MGTGFRAGIMGLLLPQRCVVCGRGEEGLLCGPCRGGMIRLRGPLCARCGAPTAWLVERCGECAGRRIAFARARAAVAYDAAARALVAAWKERGLRRLGSAAADLVVEVVSPCRAEALTWVPADADRSRWRGLSTAEALARELAERWDLPVLALLERTRRIPRQRGLSRTARRANVRDAFHATTPPALVAVVDDVYTTGATVDSVARALARAGARRVDVVTFARAVRR
jgi:predicted amidophosphoribosyltransferase